MRFPGSPRSSSGGLPISLPRILFPVLLLPGIFLAGVAGEAEAQEEPTLEELELEYVSAVNAYEAALSAREAREIRSNRLLAEVDSARAAGDDDRLDRALAAWEQEARELAALDRRVEATAERVRLARQALLEALEIRLEGLLAEVDSAGNPEEEQELGAILLDMRNRYLELRAQEDPPVEVEVAALPTISPRDTPADLRRKANLLDDRGDRYEALIADLDGRLESLRAAQRTSRAVEDFVAGIERYDDARLPVVPPGAGGVSVNDPEEAPPSSDSLGPRERPMTLEERIESLEFMRARLEEYLEQVRERAELFRREAGGGTVT